MIPISEKSSGGPLVDWVPEGHDRKYTEPAAMSIRIAATPLAWFAFDARGIDRFFPIKRRAVIGAPRRRPCGGARWKLSHFKPDTCVGFAVLQAGALRADAATGRGPGGQDCRSVPGRHGAAVAGDGPRIGDFKYRMRGICGSRAARWSH